MKKTNQPQTPRPIQALPVYRHKGIISIIVLAVIAIALSWIYLISNQPLNLGPIVIQHRPKVISEPQPATSSPIQAPSTELDFETAKQMSDPSPVNLRASQTGSAVKLTWVPVDLADITQYKIYRYEGSSSLSLGNPFSLKLITTLPARTNGKLTATYVDSTIKSGMAYSYFVTDINGFGVESDYSNIVSVKIK